jgi:hypothetical protein
MAMGYFICGEAKADALDATGENYMFGSHHSNLLFAIYY